MRAVLVVPFLLAAAVAAPATDEEEQCDPAKCKGSQNCMCASIKPPNGIEAKDMPQMVMLPFEGAVNAVNMPFYRELMDTTGQERTSRAGARSGTTRLRELTSTLDYLGRARASQQGQRNRTAIHHTQRHHGLLVEPRHRRLESRDSSASATCWPPKPQSQPRTSTECRLPVLTTGGDKSFKMIKEAGLLYDASIPHNRVKDSGRIMFPYTLDYGIQTPCVIEPCPKDKYPGVWTIPLNVWFKENQIEHLED
uniref:Putative peritrophic membrane chitin binding protein n=1 Tax=Ixodes ricinus TaxID=34613 RepID=A0A090XEI1_IXORI